MANGYFICIEGVDGSGKTTLANWISDYIRSEGVTCVHTREPGGTPVGEQIRRILIHQSGAGLTPLAELALVTGARQLHIEQVIKPNVDAGRIVLSERFVDSTYAYQGAGRGIEYDLIGEMHDRINGGYIPDITFVLDGDPAILAERVNKRGELDTFELEGLDFQDACREVYLNLAMMNPNNYKVINAEQEFDIIVATIKPTIDELIHNIKNNHLEKQR